jgi:hypothetical protein
MRAGSRILEVCRSAVLQRGVALSFLALIANLVAIALTSAQPPSDSLASKYAPAKTEEPKPAAAAEPDPTANCPWLDHIFDDEAVMSLSENREEFYAYNYFVTLARGFSADVLAKHADKRLTWRVLFERDRDKYRGQIVHVEGRLKRLVYIGSNKSLESQGVKDLYEAWIFDEHYFNNPTCVIISDLLPGQKAGEDITGVNASCDGYFFKRYKYRAVNDTRLAPLVIGHTIVITQPPVTTDAGAEAFGRLFLPTVFILALAMVVLAFILHRWFSKSDQEIQRRLLSARFGNEFVAPIDRLALPNSENLSNGPGPFHDDAP